MKSFQVVSLHLVNDEPVEVVEVTRTDRKVAEEDAKLIREVLGRKAWVVE